MSRNILRELDAKKGEIVDRALRLAREHNLDIRGQLLPQGETYDLKQVFAINRWTEQYVYEMISVAREILETAGVNYTVYIVNTLGNRDTASIGFSCPDDEKLAEVMGKTHHAKQIIEFASGFAPEEREAYLEKFRRNGLDGYL